MNTAKLYFYYSTMNAGKTTALLQNHYNYTQKNLNTLIFLPKTANNHGNVTSRIGMQKKGIILFQHFNLFKYIKTYNYKFLHAILIDEAQFLQKKQIFQIISIVDILNISVLTYGLRTDFKSRLFKGSKYLLALADKLVELKTTCSCKNKATMNIRLNHQGQKTLHGKQIEINKNLYTSTCRKHYYKYN